MNARKRFRLISCEIFHREMLHVVSRSPHLVDIEFLPKGLHDVGCREMLARIQKVVDAVDPERYDAVLLGYGLCNNGLTGLAALRVPLVLPRAHDCITLFMGSGERYLEYFNSHPGVYFKTTGWIERGGEGSQLQGMSIQNRTGMDLSFEDLVERYGEDNARFLYSELHGNERGYRQYTFIEMGVEPDASFEQSTREQAAEKGWAYEKLTGDLRLIRRLVEGEWDPKDFLVVPVGYRVKAHYGEGLIEAEPLDSPLAS